MQEYKYRILVVTDLFGRGIDIERVNIVINYDFPDESNQYLHRVGRAGRFGTKGLAISFISREDDEKILAEVQGRFAVQVPELPEQIDTSTYSEFFLRFTSTIKIISFVCSVRCSGWVQVCFRDVFFY